MKTIKQSVEMRNSVCHSATIYANAIMHAGTTVDTFLRDNLVKHLSCGFFTFTLLDCILTITFVIIRTG